MTELEQMDASAQIVVPLLDSLVNAIDKGALPATVLTDAPAIRQIVRNLRAGAEELIAPQEDDWVVTVGLDTSALEAMLACLAEDYQTGVDHGTPCPPFQETGLLRKDPSGTVKLYRYRKLPRQSTFDFIDGMVDLDGDPTLLFKAAKDCAVCGVTQADARELLAPVAAGFGRVPTEINNTIANAYVQRDHDIADGYGNVGAVREPPAKASAAGDRWLHAACETLANLGAELHYDSAGHGGLLSDSCFDRAADLLIDCATLNFPTPLLEVVIDHSAPVGLPELRIVFRNADRWVAFNLPREPGLAVTLDWDNFGLTVSTYLTADVPLQAFADWLAFRTSAPLLERHGATVAPFGAPADHAN